MRDRAPRGRLGAKARDRIASLIGDASPDDRTQIAETRNQFQSLGLSDFDVYMALLFQASERRDGSTTSGSYWIRSSSRISRTASYVNRWADGASGGLPSVPECSKRFLVALIQDTDRGLREARPVRLDRLIDRLDNRYGILVARPPTEFEGDPAAVSAMLENQRMLRRRLRESGLFVDLSDAFLGQTLRPRIEVRA